MRRQHFLIALMISLLAACGGEPEDTRPGQPVKHRQEAFKAILRSFEPINKQLKSDKPDVAAIARLADELAARRDAPWAHFGPDTLYPPSKAKADIWQRPAEFERERQTFVDAVGQLQAAVRTQDLQKIRPAYDRLQASCKSCHRDFRN